MLIGWTGEAGAGKDEVTKILIKEFGFERFAFADKLKESIQNIFKFHNPEKDEKSKNKVQTVVVTKEDVTNEFSKYLRGERFTFRVVDLYFLFVEVFFPYVTNETFTTFTMEISYRRACQLFGTDVMRVGYKDSVWVDELQYDNTRKVSVTDVRFENERQRIKSLDGCVVKIVNPRAKPVEHHISESGIPDSMCDDFLLNDGSLDKLREKVISIYNTLLMREV